MLDFLSSNQLTQRTQLKKMRDRISRKHISFSDRTSSSTPAIATQDFRESSGARNPITRWKISGKKKFILSSRFNDLPSRFNVLCTNSKDLSSHFKDLSLRFKDLSLRFSVSRTGFKHLSSRFKDLSSHFSVSRTGFKDLNSCSSDRRFAFR